MDVKQLDYLLAEIASDVADARKLLAPRTVTDHQVRARPKVNIERLPVGGVFLDPTFGSRIMRVTDENTAGGGQTWRTSSGSDRQFNADSTKFFVENGGGGVRIFNFDAASFTITPWGASPLVGPTWHQTDPMLLFGADPGVGPKVAVHNLATGVSSILFDALDLAPIAARPRTYLRGIAHAGDHVSTICGGEHQDLDDHAVLISLKGLPLRVIDLPNHPIMQTMAHFGTLDLSGRYFIIGSTQGSINNGRATGYVWDTMGGTFKAMNHSAGGHGAVGFGCSVNAPDDIDSQEYRFRSYADPDVATLINQAPPMMEGASTPWVPQWSQANHISWNNAAPLSGPGRPPFIVGNYRYGAGYDVTPATPWRPWDDEIIRVHFDGTVERFAHHQSDVRQDTRPLTHIAYWATPRPKVDRSGRYVLFTSNWGKTLGAYPSGAGEGSAFREDVFLLELTA